MKLGDVLKKERENRELSVEETAGELGISTEEYAQIEAGESPAEEWGPRLAQIAIQLAVPTSRLLAESGRAEDCKPGQAGQLIKQHRETLAARAEEIAAERGISVEEYREKQEERDGWPRYRKSEEIAEAMGITVEEYGEVEAGKSPIEKYGPLLLRFAEVIEQPVFNLFYPCGLPFQELDDYP